MTDLERQDESERGPDGVATRHRSAVGLIATVVAVIVCADLTVASMLQDVNIGATTDRLIDVLCLSAATAVALWFIALAPLRRDADRERAMTRHRSRQLVADAAQ